MGTAESVISGQSGVPQEHDAGWTDQRYRALVETALDIISILDADATFRFINPAVRRVLGYDPEELVGRNAFTLLHPDDVARVQAIWARWAGTPGAMVREQYRDRHKNGSWVNIETAATNLLDDPAVRGIVLNSRDVTDCKHAEAALRHSEERYRCLLANLPDVTWTSAVDGTTTYISENVNYVLGYTAEEMCRAAMNCGCGAFIPTTRNQSCSPCMACSRTMSASISSTAFNAKMANGSGSTTAPSAPMTKMASATPMACSLTSPVASARKKACARPNNGTGRCSKETLPVSSALRATEPIWTAMNQRLASSATGPARHCCNAAQRMCSTVPLTTSRLWVSCNATRRSPTTRCV